MAIDFDSLLVAGATGMFGARVMWSRSGVDETPIAGIFDRFHLEIGLTDRGAPVTTNRAQVFVRFNDFPAGYVPQQGDGIAVALLSGQQVDADAPPDGASVESYFVSDVQRDGIGGALLMLTSRTVA